MNLKNQSRVSIYLSVLLILAYLLLKEYTYVHPYNTGFFILGPKWTYASTCTFTWCFLVISSIVMVTPLFRKQKAGFLGLLLFILVLIRPIVQYNFPEETAVEFYKDRKMMLNQIVKQYPNHKNRTIITDDIKELGFDNLTIHQNTYYFMVCSEEWPFGVCYNDNSKLSTENFGNYLKYKKIDKNWYEFDY